MNNEELDLVKILKDVPSGTTFYCTLFGDVQLFAVERRRRDYPLGFFLPDGSHLVLQSNGHFSNSNGGECVIFPSRDNRDWSTYKYVPSQRHGFKPYDKVLVRDEDSDKWRVGIFSHFDESGEYPYKCIGESYHYCIPYEGNESLAFTNDMPKGGEK